MVIDIILLNKYLDNGLLINQKHPTLDLYVWNYSKHTQFEKLWDENTLLCRGLVTDGNGNIVSPCIKKFFNYEELTSYPNEEFDVYMKYDGSYISMFMYNGKLMFTSRGSFISDQSQLASKIFHEKYENVVKLSDDVNYIMELVGPSNRIVLDYPENDLVLLTSYDIASYVENDIYNDSRFDGFNKAKKYNGLTDFKLMKTEIPNDEEGYVIRFKNGFRMKLKGSEYIMLHSSITNLSSISVWEAMYSDGGIDSLISVMPDETYGWIHKIKDEIISNYLKIENDTKEIFEQYKHIKTKKDFVETVNKLIVHKGYRWILFKMYDNRDYKEIIINLVKPKRTVISTGMIQK